MKRSSESQQGIKSSVLDEMQFIETRKLAKQRKLNLQIMDRDELEEFATTLNKKFHDSKLFLETIYSYQNRYL